MMPLCSPGKLGLSPRFASIRFRGRGAWHGLLDLHRGAVVRLRVQRRLVLRADLAEAGERGRGPKRACPLLVVLVEK